MARRDETGLKAFEDELSHHTIQVQTNLGVGAVEF